MLDEKTVHIISGGIGGTVGAILTCPLEVIKVRLQSSQGVSIQHSSSAHIDPIHQHNPVNYGRDGRRPHRFLSNYLFSHDHTLNPPTHHHHRHWTTSECCHGRFSPPTSIPNSSSYASTATMGIGEVPPPLSTQYTGIRRSVLVRCLMDIAKVEGFRALFKGIVPTLFGVLPSRGVYFCAYHEGQIFFQPYFAEGSSAVYLCSAGMGSITASSLTNPIWFIKTRLQLDSRPSQPPITVLQVIKSTLKQDGIRGFYRGVSASYVGSLETSLNFVVYENVKSRLLLWDHRRKATAAAALTTTNCPPVTATIGSVDFRGSRGGSKLGTSSNMILCMLASATAKIIAITAFYPHEVVRTRLREVSGRYRGFVNTLRKVVHEEGLSGLYRGMGTHYIRQVPNSCIMIGTYEVVVFLLHSRGMVKLSEL